MRNIQRTSYARRIKALSDERARLQRELREARAEVSKVRAAWQEQNQLDAIDRLRAEIKEERARGDHWHLFAYQSNGRRVPAPVASPSCTCQICHAFKRKRGNSGVVNAFLRMWDGPVAHVEPPAKT